MSILSHFFNKKKQPVTQTLSPNPAIKNPISFSIIFNDELAIDKDYVLKKLRNLDLSMNNTVYQDLSPQTSQIYYALIGWQKHIIKVIGFNAPLPKDSLEKCVAPAHYSQDIKQKVYQHDSHLILYYCGYDENILEQYVALTKVATAFENANALVVLNENAHTSLPIQAISNMVSEKDGLDSLCSCLPVFFCGFVKYEIEGVAGVWMRTYGAELFGLPNFAILASHHNEGEKYLYMFNDILLYLQNNETKMVAGDTMEMGDGQKMSLRNPFTEEYFLNDKSTVLVVEVSHQ